MPTTTYTPSSAQTSDHDDDQAQTGVRLFGNQFRWAKAVIKRAVAQHRAEAEHGSATHVEH